MPKEAGAIVRPSTRFSSLPQLLEYNAKHLPDAPAILAPGRPPLTYGHFFQHVRNTERALRAMGIGRHDRVAVALPNGPEMAVAILAVAASAVCIPLNPAYQIEELDRYFADLRPRALIIAAVIDSPARRVALSRAVRVIELSAMYEAAGLFTLKGEREDAPPQDPVSPADVAVLLLTSGTTARPKIVPQTHANICASACGSVAAWQLSETDRCINMLPLFHGHGLHNTLTASLAVGASVVCTPGWDAKNFFTWLTTFQPTWYSAVSTIHQAILAQARQDRGRRADCHLRLIRSGSAPLPAHVLAELESTFETPVIEYYAMTETVSTPIASNPLPPGRRKVGSPGKPVTLEVAIMNESGAMASDGQAGEVVVRGAGVMAGYLGDPIATQAAFTGDWLRTGDLGRFDEDGYLFLVGRVRERINRGGEKITPQEVDEVLLQHPAVAEAVTFAVPHATLGEDVASAVVLRPQSAAKPKQIRRFAIGRIANFKIPRQVLIVREIPKGPSGKVKRFELAAKLGLAKRAAMRPPFVPPESPIEKALAALFVEILGLEQVGVHDNFFALGGDSLSATHFFVVVHEKFHVELDTSLFFEGPTIAEIARHLAGSIQMPDTPRARAAITRLPRKDGIAPTSVAQEQLWKLQRTLPEIPFFNVLYPLRVTGAVDSALLERSINEIVQRHEILRTVFAIRGRQLLQIVAPQLKVPLSISDLATLRASLRQAAAQRIVEAEMFHRFALTRGPLIKAHLITLTKSEHRLLICLHQTVCDGWSLGVFIDELISLYDAFSAGNKSPLPPPPIQYSDFAAWQRDWRSHPEIAAQLSYWREQLRGPLPSMRLSRSRPKTTTDELVTARRPWSLPSRLITATKRFSRQEDGTLFMALVAALQTLLRHHLGENDVRVAANVANRNRLGTEGIIGPLVNTVILRTNLGGDPTARDVLRRVRAITLKAFGNQDLPIEEIAETLNRESKLKAGALASVMILLQNERLRPLAAAANKFRYEEANPSTLMPLLTLTPFDVILMLRESGDRLAGTCVYKPHLFTGRTIDRLLREFEAVLEGMVTRPEQSISSICTSLRIEPRAALRGAHRKMATMTILNKKLRSGR
jgi:acyl-CoA synthetase (AMP-forming)/AMP-acid ligase II/acyl carrier protein